MRPLNPLVLEFTLVDILSACHPFLSRAPAGMPVIIPPETPLPSPTASLALQVTQIALVEPSPTPTLRSPTIQIETPASLFTLTPGPTPLPASLRLDPAN
jgi:hypothetical protein